MPSTAAAAAGPTTPDHALVRRFLAGGDGEDFRRLVQPHLPMIRRLLFTLLRGQREDMEDAEQEILAELPGALARFDFRCSFRTFFYSLARHRALDLLRSACRRRRLLERLRLHARASPAAQGPDPAEQAERSIVQEGLLAAFGELSPAQRQLVLMKDIEGFGIEEIAGLLALPEGTVKSRLHRARARLARLLRGRI